MITHTIQPTEGVLRFEVTGRFDLAEFRETMASVVRHPDYRLGMPSIWIMHPESVADLHRDEVAAVADDIVRMKEQRGGAWKIAIVSRTPADSGMSRMLQILADAGPATIELFEKEADAVRWATANG